MAFLKNNDLFIKVIDDVEGYWLSKQSADFTNRSLFLVFKNCMSLFTFDSLGLGVGGFVCGLGMGWALQTGTALGIG